MATITTDLHSQEGLAGLAQEIAAEGFRGAGTAPYEESAAYEALVKAGSELWLDTGDKEAACKVWAKELHGLTTNNNLVNQVVQTGALDETISKVGKRMRERFAEMPADDLIIEAAFILNAKIALGLVEEFGARVSVELHPNVSNDWRSSVSFGKRYFALNQQHFIIKVPMTPDGFIAVRRLSSEGIPVNFTLNFSARQNYFAALFSRPRYVNVFLGRLGNLVEDNGLGRRENIGEHVTLTSQEHIERLRTQKHTPTQQIAASIRSGEQVEHLAGVDVLTIPPKAAREYLSRETYKRGQIKRHASSEFQVHLEDDEKGDSITEGVQIVELAHEYGVTDFFREWTDEELQRMEAGGKIPKWSDWSKTTGADEMMSVAALRSFAKDQRELDERVAGLIG